MTPVISEDQQTINDALLDKGEEVTYFPDTYKAVSYTHLDVYKRQGKKKMRQLGSVSLPSEAFTAVLKLDSDDD